MTGNGKTEFGSRLDVEHELPAAEDEREGKSSETEAASRELERMKAERNSLVERLARLQAEFENARKRQVREQQEFRDYALVDTLRLLLPILDSFDRALATPAGGEEFRNGVELINRQLHDAMSKLGVQPIQTEGQPFDPNLHQAVEMVETDEAEDNHVLSELQRGYKIKERLLRPAMVRVARKP